MPPCDTASFSCQVLRPVRMLARHGLHLGFDVKAFLNNTPSRAKRSKFGVFTHVLPYAPACCQPQSSKMMKRMLGRVPSAARVAGALKWNDDAMAANTNSGNQRECGG